MRKNYNIPLNDNSIMDINCSPQSSFMPNFLMGANNNPNDSFFNSQSKLPMNSIPSFSPFETKPARQSNLLKRHESIHDGSRKGGPPICSLRSRSPKSSYTKSMALTNDMSFKTNGFSMNSPSIMNRSIHRNGPIKNQNNNSVRESETYSRFLNKSGVNEPEDDYENWITVFGYTPNEAQYILTYFSEIGNIKEKKISNSGNWMHLQYENRMHAVAALSRNGRIINMNIMIGVKNCDDKVTDVPSTNRFKELPSVMNQSTANLNSSRIFEEPSAMNCSFVSAAPDRLNTSLLNSSMRSLAAPLHPTSPTKNDSSRPPRSGMLSRAMSMVFGRK